MREIKFRIWDDVNKKMLCPAMPNLDGKGAIWINDRGERNWDFIGGKEQYKVMQYTGLNDCKRTEKYPEGQPIYEGDILHFKAYQGGGFWCPIGTDIYYEIVFTNHNIGCNACSEYIGYMAMSPKGNLSSIDYLVNCHKAEIISNIYENPELLEVVK